MAAPSELPPPPIGGDAAASARPSQPTLTSSQSRLSVASSSGTGRSGRQRASRRYDETIPEAAGRHRGGVDINMTDYLIQQQEDKAAGVHGVKSDDLLAAAAGQLSVQTSEYKSTEQMIKDIQSQESNIALFRFLKRVTGIRALEKRVVTERVRRLQPDFRHPFPWLKDGMEKHSLTFESVFGLIMMANGCVIGVQLSVENSEGIMYEVAEHFFTAIFLIEIIIRMMLDGWTWVYNFYNFCDFALVMVTGVLTMWILGPAGVESAFVRRFQVIRVLRLIRVVRAVRTIPFFAVLWTLIGGLIDSFNTLFWTFVMIVSVLWTFAIFAVYWIGRAPEFEDDPEAQMLFGDVVKTLLTLFQIVTLDSWTAIARPLMKKSGVIVPFFLVVIAVVTFVLMNLITAVIVEHAFNQAKEDEELVAHHLKLEQEAEIAELGEIFKEIDLDGSGFLDKEEYEQAVMYNPRIKAKIQILEMSQQELLDLWDLFAGVDGELAVEEFERGMRSIRGEARAKETFTCVRRLHRVNKRMSMLSQTIGNVQAEADLVHQEFTHAHQRFGAIVKDIIKLVEIVSPMLPPDSAIRKKPHGALGSVFTGASKMGTADFAI
eukprot:gnl/MRDRNA2_/MRDRNA2_95871_c0_seq1.p1 gnl/MRDRNA2_/MRDRNA2_95871_c0~~gnl/MRDRNA2_/MRDRNA2_95871_c0_seq1.p1  ORF type:complete len:602 (+),score=119.71 gnl/MRDRNA2_/MRDRNA2_95871_c0_seq1:112-1917(+)